MILVRRGPLLNQTLASLKFDQWGTPTGIKYTLCDSWDEIKNYADELLCIDSGTVFNDPIKFLNDLKNYPHYGLIGHIIDPKDLSKFYFLHEQCFFIDTRLFTEIGNNSYLRPQVKRSEINLHDDYTPLWLSPAFGDTIIQKSEQFSESIVAEQLRNNRSVVNWSNTMRDNKRYLYNQPDLITQWMDKQLPYINVAENQLWIFNNENMSTATTEVFLGPAAGLYWIKNLLSENVQHLDLVDISRIQIEFVNAMIHTWDGNNYGKFVYNFIKSNNVKHWQLEAAVLTKLEKLKLLKAETFISTVNDIFSKHFDVTTFQKQWINAISSKTINVHHQNLVKFLPDYNKTNCSIWVSNILDYKYTLLKNTVEEIELFLSTLNDRQIIQL